LTKEPCTLTDPTWCLIIIKKKEKKKRKRKRNERRAMLLRFEYEPLVFLRAYLLPVN